MKAQLTLDTEVVELKPGDKLFSSGDPIDSVHYVIRGCFSRLDDGGKDLDEEGNQQLARDSLLPEMRHIEQGFLGHEVALDSDRLHHFCLVAEQPSQVLKIKIAALATLLADDHDFRKRVYRSVVFADPENGDCTDAEFLSAWDLTGLLTRKQDGSFYIKSELEGRALFDIQESIPLDDHALMGVVQKRGEASGKVEELQADGGVQLLMFNINYSAMA